MEAEIAAALDPPLPRRQLAHGTAPNLHWKPPQLRWFGVASVALEAPSPWAVGPQAGISEPGFEEAGFEKAG